MPKTNDFLKILKQTKMKTKIPMEQTAKTNLELGKNEGNQEAQNNTWGARTFLHKKAQPKHAEKTRKDMC